METRQRVRYSMCMRIRQHFTTRLKYAQKHREKNKGLWVVCQKTHRDSRSVAGKSAYTQGKGKEAGSSHARQEIRGAVGEGRSRN